MSAGVTAMLAVAVAAMLVGAASGGEERVRSTTALVAQAGDRHSFPRTLAFWKCGDVREIARRDMSVGYASCPDPAKLRRLNPKGIFLLSPGLFPKNSLDAYGGTHVTYGQGLWHWREGMAWKGGGCDKVPGPVNVGCMRPFNFDWDYMWNSNGTIAGIYEGTSGHRGFNLADPNARGTRELVAKFFAYTAKLGGLYTRRWDGVFSDNWTYSAIGESWAYGRNLDTNRDRKVDDYAALRVRWNDGLNEVGKRIRSYLPRKIVGGNGSWFPMWLGYRATDPDGWLKASNLTMVEDISGFYTKPSPADLLRIASRWLSFRDPAGLPRYVLFQLDALTSDGKHLSIPSTANPNARKYMLDQGVMRSMRWGLTLALLGGAYFEIIVDDRHDTFWWYDEYDGGKGIRRRGFLGRALGPRIQLRPAVWRRNFTNGVALNNSSSAAVTVDLNKPFRRLRGTQNPRLNNGKLAERVTIPGHDGLILLSVDHKP